MTSVDLTDADQAAIGEVLFTLASGFREADASRFESVYVEDATGRTRSAPCCTAATTSSLTCET
jgi:hypothetical protein